MASYLKRALRVNGIPIGVSSVQVSEDEQGMVTERTARGALTATRRGITRVVTAKTVPYDYGNAASIERLVEGQGASLPFDNLLINRGISGVLTAGGFTLSSTTPVAGASCLVANTGAAATYTWSSAALNNLFAGSRGCTICFWARCATDGAYTWVQLQNSVGGDAGIIVSRNTGGTVTLTYPGYGAITSPTGPAVSTTDWHMITAVLRDTTLFSYPAASLYIDGAPVASLALPATAFPYAVRDTLIVGPGSTTAAMSLDELVVYPFPLSTPEVAGLFLATTPNYASSPSDQRSPTPRETNSARNLPMVFVSGDSVGNGFYAVGHVSSAAIQAVHRDPVTAALLTNGKVLDLQFFEAAAAR